MKTTQLVSTVPSIRRLLLPILSEISDTPLIPSSDQLHLRADLGLDSLDLLEVIMRVESYLQIRIPERDWNHIQTIGELTTVLATYGHLHRRLKPGPIEAQQAPNQLP